MSEDIILVDKNDNQIGTGEKMDVHKKGLLHRAFSVMVWNEKGEILLQQRALDKYHSPGLWSNTCCSHPKPGETVIEAANRRLKEEMGFECELKQEICVIYRSQFDNGLIENEYDHVITGRFDGNPEINPSEVNAFRWISASDLLSDVALNPENYTVWFKIILDRLENENLL